jgi:hypothetical protein
MERLIAVDITGRHVFSESEIIDAFDLKDPTNIELLDYAHELIKNLDANMLIDLAHIEANFLYDYDEGDMIEIEGLP